MTRPSIRIFANGFVIMLALLGCGIKDPTKATVLRGRPPRRVHRRHRQTWRRSPSRAPIRSPMCLARRDGGRADERRVVRQRRADHAVRVVRGRMADRHRPNADRDARSGNPHHHPARQGRRRRHERRRRHCRDQRYGGANGRAERESHDALAAEPHDACRLARRLSQRCMRPDADDACDRVRDQPENGLGDGDTAPDWSVQQAGLAFDVSVRAERSGLGDGRVYTIGAVVTDRSGNSAAGGAQSGTPQSIAVTERAPPPGRAARCPRRGSLGSRQ